MWLWLADFEIHCDAECVWVSLASNRFPGKHQHQNNKSKMFYVLSDTIIWLFISYMTLYRLPQRIWLIVVHHVICCKCHYFSSRLTVTDWCLAECNHNHYLSDPQTEGRTTIILCNPDWSWEWLEYFSSGSSTAKPRLGFLADLETVKQSNTLTTHTQTSCKTWLECVQQSNIFPDTMSAGKLVSLRRRCWLQTDSTVQLQPAD